MRSRLTVFACLAAAVALGGCQLAQPLLQPPSAAAPSASPSDAGPSSKPGASATPRPEQAAIAAFIERIQSGKLTYQATFAGRVRAAGDRLATRGSLAVAGGNYRLIVGFTFPGSGTTRIEHRYVGGRAWLREDRGRWTPFANFLAEQSMSPFTAIVDETDVKFMRRYPAQGAVPERYRIEVPTGFFHPLLIPATNLSAREIDRTSLELVIDANGVPVAGSSAITGRGRVSGQLQEILIDANLAFKSVGARVVVAAP